MKLTPLWTEQFPRPDDLADDQALPEKVDVVIVGSGYTGLNAARTLVGTGATVAVLEQETIGFGASSRNGGMATPGIKQDIRVINQRYGADKAHQFWQASLDAIDLIDQIVREEQIDCDWQRKGHVGLAYKMEHFEAMRRKQAWLKNTFGHETTLVSREELSGEIGSDLYFGGLADETSGGLQPAKYVFGLARSVAKKGVHLCEKVRAEEIRRANGGFEVRTGQGLIKAGQVLIATNGYTDRLVPRLKPKVFPVGSYIVVTEPLSPDLQAELSPKGRMFYDSKWFLNYFRLTPDGRMLWGGRNNLSTSLDLRESARLLTRGMIRAFPQLEGVPTTHSWSGKLGITFDLMPHIGREDGVWYAFGYGGHGLSIATYLGTEVGRLMAGEISASPFMEISHQTMFFYRNQPWFLPFAALWFRFRDAVS